MEVSNQNIGFSDNEEEKNEKLQKENEIKQTEERNEPEDIPDKNTAFHTFKTESPQGVDIERGIMNTSEDLRTRKREAKEYLDNCNTLKQQIDNIKNALNDKKLNKLNLGDDMTELIDEEGYKLIDELKAYKQNYKENLDKFKFAKSEINSVKSNLDYLKIKYVEGFENWFLKRYGIKLEEHELKMSKVNIIL